MNTSAHLVSGTTHLKAILSGPPIKVGDQVTLIGDDRRWHVVEAHPQRSRCFYHRGWNNNI